MIRIAKHIIMVNTWNANDKGNRGKLTLANQDIIDW